MPPGQVGFDDMCGLQDYFDKLEIRRRRRPGVVSAVDLEGNSGGKAVHGGRERFAFEGEFQLTNLRRVLEQNWKRLPEPIAKASTIEVEVRWSEKAGTKRVLTDQSAELRRDRRPGSCRTTPASPSSSMESRSIASVGPRWACRR